MASASSQWNPQRIGLTVFQAGLVALVIALSVQLIGDLRTQQRLQADRAELQDVRYGLLDAEIWIEQVSVVVADQIDTFELTEANRPEIQQSIAEILDRLLLEVEQHLRRRNSAGDTWVERFKGALQQGVQDFVVDFDELRARVPTYAEAVVDELNRPESRERIKAGLLETIQAAADATFTKMDRSAYFAVLKHHGCDAKTDCITKLEGAIGLLQQSTQRRALALAGLVIVLFAIQIAGFRRRMEQPLPPEGLVFLTLTALALLAAGVWTPMIEIEARIDELRFEILGTPLLFTDQVLYFQSKSILDVVRILTRTGEADMILVAVLITLFSLVFPTLKVLAGFVYYLDFRGLRNNPLIYFFALRSGKWSMADVLVIAILMAYVGFSGLVSSQLAGIASASEHVSVINSNGTSLQFGFFLFLGFVLANLLLSALLEARVHRRVT